MENLKIKKFISDRIARQVQNRQQFTKQLGLSRQNISTDSIKSDCFDFNEIIQEVTKIECVMESVDMGIDSTTHSINLNLNNAFENSKVLEHKESSKLIL